MGPFILLFSVDNILLHFFEGVWKDPKYRPQRYL